MAKIRKDRGPTTGSGLPTLPLGYSLRLAASKLHVPTSTLAQYLRTGTEPKRHPGLTQRLTQLLETRNPKPEPLSPQEDRMLTKLSLPPEVCHHFGLTRDPFTSEIDGVEDIYESRALKRAENKILAAIDRAGWVAVTGPVGSGKTTLLKKVEARLTDRRDVDLIRPQTLEKQYLSAGGICDALLEDLGHPTQRKGQLEYKARAVGELLRSHYRASRKPVLIIDEAHLLRVEAILALKRLYEFETNFRKLLAIVLVGQDSLARLLKTNVHLAEASQRIDLYEVETMKESLSAYLAHKLSRAGANGSAETLFAAPAVKLMKERAQTPLEINNLAAYALYTAYEFNEKTVTPEIVRDLKNSF